ncbi:unnamed protein product, partial [Echinostoma caproni]|uniref:Condensin complex subunit 2 n=1 Tax=Echinostoma caproni TaxID=27848 RepID=A0A183A0S9_9TREM
MINIRHLKNAMWDFLEDSIPSATNPASRSPYSAASTSSAPEPPSLAGDPVVDQGTNLPDLAGNHDEHAKDQKPVSHVPGACSFSELIDSLSSRISWQMAKELSISIALNCLLHLSNEKPVDPHGSLNPFPVIDFVSGPRPSIPDQDGDQVGENPIEDLDEGPDICISDDDDLGLPFERAFTQPTTVGLEYGFPGDLELISQPRKIA